MDVAVGVAVPVGTTVELPGVTTAPVIATISMKICAAFGKVVPPEMTIFMAPSASVNTFTNPAALPIIPRREGW